jgi:hypothetical protein
MSSFSDYMENKNLDHLFGGPDYARPATVDIALCTAAPTDASTGLTIAEATYTGYARKSVTNNNTNFPAASGGSKSNGVAIAFADCSGGSSTVTHFVILEGGTNNIMGWAQLASPKAISSGDPISFPIGSLVITLD